MALARFEDFIGGLLQREGGYANNLGGTGEEVNMGITKASYPHLNIRGMTEQQATSIYKRDFWDRLPMEGLSQRAADIAADASVHSGVGFGRELIAGSGGDPDKMLQMRRDKYNRIMENDPSKRQFRRNWMGRVDKFSPSRYSSGGQAGGGQTYDSMPQQQQVQTAQGTAVQEGGQNPGSVQDMLARIEELRPEPLTGMQRMGGAMAEGFANQKPYQGMSAIAGFMNAYGAGQRMNAKEKLANRAYEFKAMSLQRELLKGEKQNEWKKGDEGLLFRTKNDGTLETKQMEGGEKSTSPEWMPDMYGGDPSKYFTQADSIGDGARKALGPFEEGAKHFNTVRATYKANPDTGKWTNSDAIVAVKSLEKLLDPTSIVRGSESAAYEAGASILEKYKRLLQQGAEGGTPLAKAEIDSILTTLNRVYAASLPQAEAIREGWKERGVNRGVIQYGEEGDITRNDAFTIHDWSSPMDLSGVSTEQPNTGVSGTGSPVPIYTPAEQEFIDEVEDDR